MEEHTYSVVGPDVGQENTALRLGDWALVDQAWCLVHSSGFRLRLTVSERAILACLFQSSDQGASHRALIGALQHEWRLLFPSRPKNPQMHGVISRLRARAEQAGCRLPIQSLRGYGYVWDAQR